MRNYGKISTSIWRSKKFNSLTSDSHRLYYLYLHTCHHSNSIGLYSLPIGYAMADLEWSKADVLKAIDSLSEAELIAYDKDESLVRIIGYLTHDPFTNQKHAAGAIKIALALPDSIEKLHLFKDIVADRFACDDASAGAELYRLSKAYEIGYRNQEPKPEPKPEPEPISVKPETLSSDLSDCDVVFDHWRSVMGHDKSKLDDKRKSLIRRAIKLGYSVDDLKNSITGYSQSPFHMGDNDKQTRYDGLDLILRDGSKIDAGLAFFANPPRQRPGNHTTIDDFNDQVAGVVERTMHLIEDHQP